MARRLGRIDIVARSHTVESAQVVLPCPEPLADTLQFFTALGFRVRTIMPADHPTTAVLVGHGLALRLQVGGDGAPGVLRLLCTEGEPGRRTAPNGTIVEFVDANTPLLIPPLRETFVLTRMVDSPDWGAGRAGMQYRDLIPDRLGGRFIASHILIPDGGPVADYVHYHDIRFQLIYCYRGWVRLVYEDQGEPFVMHAGDCVLQPPLIRHRVLEASPAMQVIEIGCPAEHETSGDLEMTLPTGRVLPDRDFGGQRFVYHQAAHASWQPSRLTGYEQRDTGIGTATDGLAGVRVVRPVGAPAPVSVQHRAEFAFAFVLDGSLTLTRDSDQPLRLVEGDCFVVPAATTCTISDPSADLQLLDVTLPADG